LLSDGGAGARCDGEQCQQEPREAVRTEQTKCITHGVAYRGWVAHYGTDRVVPVGRAKMYTLDALMPQAGCRQTLVRLPSKQCPTADVFPALPMCPRPMSFDGKCSALDCSAPP
jgi:hypothetical protein